MGIILADNNFLPHAQALISGAQSSVDISTFKAEITTKPRGQELLHFFKALLAKAKAGVKVRLLINWNTERKSCPKTNLYVMTELKKQNIKVRTLKNNRCCHAKTIIVDKKNIIVGSHNLSVKSCHNNFEMSYFLQSEELAKEAAAIFDRSWLDASKF